MNQEQKEKLKEEQCKKLEKEISELEITIEEIKKQRDKELKYSQEKLDSLKYQKELWQNSK